ncbi:hypothetical protein ASPZODRAFT_157163 [Penicilliopsis zonata CBS 506.65]|uniref:Mitogen-activated protein kinase n=1 Tax=Penicilliopsis zonata CBS 506.65 TaxID=1073090 RepID=A0A1L9SSQ7_9EURO|nr:hypothetical protein ASPZODRAFT_157163 [Penicilliopsis zonata CBS 506.65]OJJ50238.1 hypothetical protein ASPZODRAFT_157163 [Penicilliopsis zonata CBS 506.65]
MAYFSSTHILGSKFDMLDRYTDLSPIGMGAFGVVCSAKDFDKEEVAIKKVVQPFSSAEMTKRTYRELKLLTLLVHENVISLQNVFISPAEDLYLVTDFMDTDLQQLLGKACLEPQHTGYFFYQIIRGLKYIHSAGVIHRDLKPSNILINAQCDVKLCDFGLACQNRDHMTGYVATRYYRSPEVMLTWGRYSTAMDIWSAGCILAEMLTGRVLFPGRNHIHQFSVITELLGMPPKYILKNASRKVPCNLSEKKKIRSARQTYKVQTCAFIEMLAVRPRQSFTTLPITDPLVIDLLGQILVYSSESRLSAAEILQHPYLAPYHDQTDEPEAKKQVSLSSFDVPLPIEAWRAILYSEIFDYLREPEDIHCGHPVAVAVKEITV